MRHVVIPTEWEEYISISMIQHVNVLYGLNKLHDLKLLKIMWDKKWKIFRSIYALILITEISCKS